MVGVGNVEGVRVTTASAVGDRVRDTVGVAKKRCGEKKKGARRELICVRLIYDALGL